MVTDPSTKYVYESGTAASLTRWPVIETCDFEAVERVLRSGRLVGGEETNALEREWEAYLGVEHCIAVSSCTHAIHVALKALGVSSGDEVIVPAFTFCGSVAPVVHCGGTPVFADVLPGTYEIDPEDVGRKITSRTRAVIPVHIHGLAADVKGLARTAGQVPIVEDACQAHGATTDGQCVGTFGAFGCFSLNQVKPLTGGQGGLVVTNDGELARKARLFTSHGGQDIVGFSYPITEFAAALARSQLTRLDSNNSHAQANAELLSKALEGHYSLIPAVPVGRTSVWHKYRLMLPRALKQQDAVSWLRDRCIPVELWPGQIVPLRTEYRRFACGDIPVSLHVNERSIVVGDEMFPLACQTRDTVRAWSVHLLALLDEFAG